MPFMCGISSYFQILLSIQQKWPICAAFFAGSMLRQFIALDCPLFDLINKTAQILLLHFKQSYDIMILLPESLKLKIATPAIATRLSSAVPPRG
jgi:hypothetical protein